MTKPDSFRIETLTRIEQLEGIAPELDELVAQTDPAFYHETNFFIPWCAAAQKLGQGLHLIIFWTTDDRLAGFVPLCRRRDPKALFAYRLTPPRIGSSPPFDILIAPEVDKAALTDAIVAQLAKTTWIDLRIPQTRADSRFATVLAPALARQSMTVQVAEEPGYYKIDGFASSDAYFKQFKSKRRIELNRLYNRFIAAANIVTVSDAADLDDAFDWMQQVLEHSWKNKKYLTETFLPLLREQLEQSFSRGRAQIKLAFKDGAPVAFLVEFINRDGTRNAYYNGHDMRENALAPGASLLQSCLREALDAGSQTYLFWGHRDYLHRLSRQTDAICTVAIRRPGFYSWLTGTVAELILGARQPRSRRA